MGRPLQSVELVLEAGDDERVRAVWQRLSDAGLPSLHDHRSSSNRPHLTLVTSPVVAPEQEQQLADAVAGRLPMRTSWDAVTTFGHDPYAVVRLVRPSPELLALHRDVAAVLDLGDAELATPAGRARWIPHVSFAVRVPGDRLEAVVALVADSGADPGVDPGADLTWASARRWDPVARREWGL